MEAQLTQLTPLINHLLPLLREFCCGEYGIALGGAHAKGVDDAESDVDLYVFARDVLPLPERDRLCAQYSEAIHDITSWGEDGPFVQGGTDFYYHGKKVEVWFRHIDYISQIIDECQQGKIKRDYVAWTVMGFFNYCTLSDIAKMIPLEDPQGILTCWKADVSVYPEKMKRHIINDRLAEAHFWPENFHYQTAIARCDVIYTVGIVQQVVYNLIQVVFALNEVYFPGEKKMEAALEHLPHKPVNFTARIKKLLFPAVPVERGVLEEQRCELVRLVNEVDGLVARDGKAR